MQDNIDPIFALTISAVLFLFWLRLVIKDLRRARREDNQAKIWIRKNGVWVPALIIRDTQGDIRIISDPNGDVRLFDTSTKDER